MADITEMQAVHFSDYRARRMANHLAQSYYHAKAIIAEWFAYYSAFFPNDASILIDGSTGTGRPVVTGAGITSVVTRAMELSADFEANGNAKLNTILAVADQPHG